MSPYGDDLALPYDGTVMRRPEPGHICTPPLKPHMMRPPAGPATWPSPEQVTAYLKAGCTHYVRTSDVSVRPGDPWETPCPVHTPPKATKVGDMAAEPVGTLWRCDCGEVWIVRVRVPQQHGGVCAAGGPPQWERATRRERRVVRPSRRTRLIGWLRRRL